MLDRIEVDPRLEASNLASDHRLNAIISRLLSKRGTELEREPEPGRTYWSAPHFGLDRVDVFKAASPAQQAAILVACSRSLLRESYYIEKGGMFYTAKISLLAKTTEERMMYSMFAADEANHFHWISRFCSREEAGDYHTHPFLNLLSEIARRETRVTLIYILQVVLEGWGMHHYRELAADCEDASLKQVFENILKDEAFHHGGGLVLFNEETLDTAQMDGIVNILQSFLQMIQAGPQSTVGVLDAVLGRHSDGERVRIFSQLDAEAESSRKLGLIAKCIRSARYGDEIIDRLTKLGSLTPFSAEICAGIS